MATRLVIGAMSGTSADGVDVALVRIDGHGLGMSASLVSHCARPFDPNLRAAIFAIRSTGASTLASLATLGRDVTLVYAAAVRDLLEMAHTSPADVSAVAAHGQTLFHAPPLTIQWLDPALLAHKTGLTVVSDFRRADCAAGGQGAPLVPFADFLLFHHSTRDRVLLNIGGIANLTYLGAGGGIDDLIAFDTGPGNCISDWICRAHDPQGIGYDVGGERAAQGRVCDALLHEVLGHPYFSRRAPKSTDGPEMIAPFAAAAARRPSLSTEDLLRTACTITARSVLRAMDELLGLTGADLIVSGGGAENRVMMEALGSGLHRYAVSTTDALGVPTAAKEAIAFAILGAATMDGLPSNVPSVTGASRAVILGSVTPRPFASSHGAGASGPR